MTRKCRTTPEEALAQYIQLGQGRTLNKVHKILANSVSYDSLKRWCHQGNWVEKAKATDRKTTEIMTEKHALELAERTFNEIQELKDINKQLLYKVSKELEKITYDLKPEQVKSLGDLALSVSKQIQVLSGGVDSRQEQLTTNIESLNKNELQTMIQTLSEDLGLSLGGVSKDSKLN
jgi:hypothetical protein